MSWWVMEQVSVNEAGTQALANIQCDNVSDLPAPDQSATLGYIIVRGSQAKVLATSENYILGSTGTWVKMEDGVKLDLTGYATEQYVDEGLADKVDTSVYSSGQAAQDAEIGVVAAMGAKNDFDIDTAVTAAAANHAAYSLSGGMLSVASTGTYGRVALPYLYKKGKTVFTCTVSNFVLAGGAANIRFAQVATGADPVRQPADVTGNGMITAEIEVNEDTQGYVIFYVNTASTSYANSADFSQIMVRRAEITDSTYVPYAPTNRELYEMILALQYGG